MLLPHEAVFDVSKKNIFVADIVITVEPLARFFMNFLVCGVAISQLTHFCSDLSMILCDPFAVNTMLWSVVKILHELNLKETLPRVSGNC